MAYSCDRSRRRQDFLRVGFYFRGRLGGWILRRYHWSALHFNGLGQQAPGTILRMTDALGPSQGREWMQSNPRGRKLPSREGPDDPKTLLESCHCHGNIHTAVPDYEPVILLNFCDGHVQAGPEAGGFSCRNSHLVASTDNGVIPMISTSSG